MKNARYCAFLRGVNVKGTNMKMAEVCAVFEKVGMEKVSSVLASGNILFSSEKKEAELKNDLEKAMSEYFKYEAFLFVKNEEGIGATVAIHPFGTPAWYHIVGFVDIGGVEVT